VIRSEILSNGSSIAGDPRKTRAIDASVNRNGSNRSCAVDLQNTNREARRAADGAYRAAVFAPDVHAAMPSSTRHELTEIDNAASVPPARCRPVRRHARGRKRST
jgi:hypothetical protein